jgi:hypothetical protein
MRKIIYVAALATSVMTAQTALGQAVIRGTDPRVAHDTNSVPGLAGTFSLENTNAVGCPAGSFASGVQAFRPNGHSKIVAIRYNCRDRRGQETAIKGTEGRLARSGPVDDWAGTYDLGNDNIVACPAGSFISGIQGFRPNGRYEIVAIRYECRDVAGRQTAVRRAEDRVATVGSVDGLAGSADLSNTLLVACPSGSFVSSMQGFKPNGRVGGEIVEIQYGCTR